MRYCRNITSDNMIITDAEIYGIDSAKISDSFNFYTYDVIKDEHNIVIGSDIKALWDTGASMSCINKKLSEQLHLPKSGAMDIHLANGTKERCPLVSLHIKLDNVFGYTMDVLEFDFSDNSIAYDFIIGLDVIKQGKLILDYFSTQPLLDFISGSEIKKTEHDNIISIINTL